MAVGDDNLSRKNIQEKPYGGGIHPLTPLILRVKLRAGALGKLTSCGHDFVRLLFACSASVLWNLI